MHHDTKSVRWLWLNRRWNSYTFTLAHTPRATEHSRTLDFRSSVQRLRKAWTIESHCNRFPRSSEIPKHCPCRLRPHDIQPPVQRSTKDKRPAWVFFLSGRGLVDLQPRNCRSGVWLTGLRKRWRWWGRKRSLNRLWEVPMYEHWAFTSSEESAIWEHHQFYFILWYRW